MSIAHLNTWSWKQKAFSKTSQQTSFKGSSHCSYVFLVCVLMNVSVILHCFSVLFSSSFTGFSICLFQVLSTLVSLTFTWILWGVFVTVYRFPSSLSTFLPFNPRWKPPAENSFLLPCLSHIVYTKQNNLWQLLRRPQVFRVMLISVIWSNTITFF